MWTRILNTLGKFLSYVLWCFCPCYHTNAPLRFCDSVLAILPHNRSTPPPHVSHILNSCFLLIGWSFGMAHVGAALHNGITLAACSSKCLKQWGGTCHYTGSSSWVKANFLLTKGMLKYMKTCVPHPKSFLSQHIPPLRNGAVLTSIQGQVPNQSKSEKLINVGCTSPHLPSPKYGKQPLPLGIWSHLS